VLIDNLRTQTGMIPGTEFRCNWNTNEDCFSDSSLAAIREIVDAHAEAGFSTDIIDYCVSAHTAAPTTGGFGILAQVPGALSSDLALTPHVYTLDYARNGWRNNVVGLPGASNPIAPPESQAEGSAGFGTPATEPDCDSAPTDYDLIRCQVNWAISATGGNVGSGQTNISLIAGAGQSVDVRTGIINTISTPGTNLQEPINTLFGSGLEDLDPTKTTVVVSNTQMGGTAAIGLKMLGYDLIPGGFINGGVARWNSLEGEQQVVEGDNLPLQSVASYAAPGKVKTGGPNIISGPTVSNVTANSADIRRVADEPATMKVEYGTVPGVFTDVMNDTILNADKTVTLTGLAENTTYYIKVTSYDGWANGTDSALTNYFTTSDICAGGRPVLSPAASDAYWATYSDYLDGNLSLDLRVSNTGADMAFNVALTGAGATNGVSFVTPAPVSMGDILGGSSATATVVFNVPMGVGSFKTSFAGIGRDCAGNDYTYP
jgi:hypothetical protein